MLLVKLKRFADELPGYGVYKLRTMLIPNILSVLIFAVICFKTYHFFKTTSRRSILRWLYFSHHDISNSKNSQKAKAKKFQNELSVLVLLLAVLDGITMLFYFYLP
jgi:hypothetical protein